MNARVAKKMKKKDRGNDATVLFCALYEVIRN